MNGLNDPHRAEVLARLYGTLQPPGEPRQLVAGSLSCEFEDGAIRGLRWRGAEVIRGVTYLLRDTNWGTVPAKVQQLQIDQQSHTFRVKFQLVLSHAEGELIADAMIEGHACGLFRFHVLACPAKALSTNRCGFVVLHPADVAGKPLVVEHTDGACEHLIFPRQISPFQPVLNIRRLRHEPLPGMTVDCRLQAELPGDPLGKFEMEDQRNWSDASFKTYAGSLFDQWPYVLPAGRTLKQSVEIHIGESDMTTPQMVSTVRGKIPAMSLGDATGVTMPLIGLGVPAGAATIDAQIHRAIVALHPAWLQAEADLTLPISGQMDELLGHLQAIHELAMACDARVQIDVLCPDGLAVQEVAMLMRKISDQVAWTPDAIRACPAAYLKSYQPADRWPDVPPLEHYALAFADAFAGTPIGGGMLTYFTELNRKRPPASGLNFIGHTTCPLVHAADDLSVMQTLEALPHIVQSVKAIWPGLAYRLGPATLAMHRNPYGDQPNSNPDRLRMAMANDDPRHQACFGAAWIAGYAASVAPLGVDVLCINHSHGASGPLLHAHQPGWIPGRCVPAWNVQRALASAQGANVYSINGLPGGLAGVAWSLPGMRPQVLLASLLAKPQVLQVQIGCIASDLSQPHMPDERWPTVPINGGALIFEPYQVLLVQQ